MITLVIVVVVLYLIWLLFIVDVTRQKKLAIAGFTLFVACVLLWIEGRDERLENDLIKVDQVHICGVQSSHTYRTNFDVSVCLENRSQVGVIQRIAIEVLAEDCQNEVTCDSLGKVQYDVLFELPPGETQTLKQNLDFKLVDPDLEGLRWSAAILRVQATNK